MLFERILDRLLEILIKIIQRPVTRTSKIKKYPLALNILKNGLFIFIIFSQKYSKSLLLLSQNFKFGNYNYLSKSHIKFLYEKCSVFGFFYKYLLV